MNDRPRIRDVARLAGTSVSTVSNLLNGRASRMGAQTLARVEAAIESLGYRPSWAARQLKTGFVPVLGLLVPSVANPFHGALALAVEEAAAARGYRVLLGNSSRDPVRERLYAEEFWQFGIRGLIAGSSPLDLGHFAELVGRGLKMVAFDRRVAGNGAEPAIDSVSMDNRRAGYLATRHLIELGHRRIGYVSAPTVTMSRRDRLDGYAQALAEDGLEPLVSSAAAPAGYDDTHPAEHGRASALPLLRAERAPTALLALNDMHALGACAAARELGLTVPDDVSVVGIDDIVLAGLVAPPLTTIRQPLDQLAAAAVDRLIARLGGEAETAPTHQTFAPELVIRRSTATPRETR